MARQQQLPEGEPAERHPSKGATAASDSHQIRVSIQTPAVPSPPINRGAPCGIALPRRRCHKTHDSRWNREPHLESGDRRSGHLRVRGSVQSNTAASASSRRRGATRSNVTKGIVWRPVERRVNQSCLRAHTVQRSRFLPGSEHLSATCTVITPTRTITQHQRSMHAGKGSDGQPHNGTSHEGEQSESHVPPRRRAGEESIGAHPHPNPSRRSPRKRFNPVPSQSTHRTRQPAPPSPHCRLNAEGATLGSRHPHPHRNP